MEERRGGQGWAARPSPLVRIGQGEGGGAPFPSPLPPLSPLVLFKLGKKGVLLPLGGGLLPLGAPREAGWPPPSLLYIRGEEGTLEHTS